MDVKIAALAFLAACSAPGVVADLGEAPPPELGRPGWVRTSARVGAWLGAVPGAAVSVVLLPVTYPISLLAEEPLGYSRTEFLFAPVTLGASIGHFALGAPADALHYLGYRAWVTHPRPAGATITPMSPPQGPGEASGRAAEPPDRDGEENGGEKKGDGPRTNPPRASGRDHHEGSPRPSLESSPTRRTGSRSPGAGLPDAS